MKAYADMGRNLKDMAPDDRNVSEALAVGPVFLDETVRWLSVLVLGNFGLIFPKKSE